MHFHFLRRKATLESFAQNVRTYFWTLNPEQETCGEARPEGCAVYTFIGNPPTRKKLYPS
jgi:hypothetical protein